MPWVAIRTGVVAADGQETILREYLCDWPACAHVAEHLVGVVRDVAMARAVCPEHAAMMQNRPVQFRARLGD
jgi:hypothetical protein